MDAEQRGPAPEEAAPPETDRLAEFRARLVALTPRVAVAPSLVAINILIAALMIGSGVHALSPAIDSLLAWGANWGPLTTGGQWWRLATSMFIHIGLIHLLMNMWVLWDAGRLIERLLGPVAFATAYLLAGLAGSLASVMWNKQIVSAGASGAIFGLFGVLGAFLLRHRRSLPPAALSALSRSTLLFVGYNVVFGLTQKQIDMAAHVGGMVGGFLAGLPLVHLLTPEARARANRRAPIVLVAGLAVVAICCALMPRIPDLRAKLDDQLPLVRRQVPGAAVLLPVGKELESRVADYERGRLFIELPESAGKMTLEWNTSEMFNEEEFEKALVEPVTQATGLTVVERNAISIAGRPGLRRFLTRPGLHPGGVAVSMWPCGQRWFNLVVASSAGASKLEERIQRSFECAPDPERDGKVRGIGLEFDLGPEFGQSEENPLVVVSLDGQAITVVPLAEHVTFEEGQLNFFQKFVQGLVGAIGLTDASVGAMTVERTANGPRRLWRGRGKREGQPLQLLVTVIECKPDRYLAFYMGAATRPESEGTKLLLGGRCSASPLKLRPFDQVESEACARGDRRGCPD